MHSTTLLSHIQTDYPQFSFVETDEFRWSASTRTIHFDPSATDATAFLLHELGHALLSHQSYSQDIKLLNMERDAWEIAQTQLATTYGINLDETVIQDNLETYREWLYRRSLCPACKMTGLQSLHGGTYTCLACGCHWKSNEARTCALRRHTL